MQTVSSTDSSSKTVKGRGRPRMAADAKATLHLKGRPEATTDTPADLGEMIATAAYFCAERRHFEPGHELDDWLTAEREIRAQLQG